MTVAIWEILEKGLTKTPKNVVPRLNSRETVLSYDSLPRHFSHVRVFRLFVVESLKSLQLNSASAPPLPATVKALISQ